MKVGFPVCGGDIWCVCVKGEAERDGIFHVTVFHCCIEQEGLYCVYVSV